MKIVHLCLDAFFIDNYSYQENILPKYHVKMGFDVTVIASLQTFLNDGTAGYLDGFSEYDDKDGYHIVRLEYKSPVSLNKFLKRYKRFSEILNRESPDIIFSHNIGFADSPVIVRYMKKHPNVKLYADNHGDYINSARFFASKKIIYPFIRKPMAKILEPYLSKCFGVTPMRCRFLNEMLGISSSLIEFLPMGVDDDAIPANREKIRQDVRLELSIPANSTVIFTGGKIDERKNTHVLISALEKIKDRDIHLLICGVLSPEMEYLNDMFRRMRNVHYLGWCNSERVMNCMVASDIACFPGTHSTLWEQSVGLSLPAVFKRWNEMDHVDVNGNCIFIKGDDVSELAIAIDCVIDNFRTYKDKASVASTYFLYSEIAKRSIGLKNER